MTPFEEWLGEMVASICREAERRGVPPGCAFGASRRRMAQIVIDMDFPAESATGVDRISDRLAAEKEN